ncbi:MAG: hypothetical protein NTW30_02640 [Candidatus Aenigmarchaeota archaeon]|nr:hypothetical protein [Candidatus Aenigmarchaeota archaeon]
MKEKIKHVAGKIKKKTHEIYDKFDKKDVAQMFTCIFVIFQVFTFPLTRYKLYQSFLLLVTSIVVCGFIVRLIAKKDYLNHLTAGILIVTILSFLIGIILAHPIENILVAMAISLPVAALVDLLKK